MDMTIFEARRKLLMQQPIILNTTPVIISYGQKTPNNSGALIDEADKCVTKLYSYPAQTSKQTLVTAYVIGSVRLYKNNGSTYADWWSWQSTVGYQRTVINIGTDALQCTIVTANLNDCYAYFYETGQILFAGKNTIYYGHQNITELN